MLPRSLWLVFWTLLSVIAEGGDAWPQFRGPTGDGQTDATGLPLSWSEKEGIVWQTPIHGRGWSSPVVWGDQIWITTAPEDGHEAYAVAVDRRSGKMLYDLKVFDVAKPQFAHSLNSYASPTPVIEPGRVYVHFGAHGTACLDTARGKILWTRRDLECDHFRGPGSSPVLVDNLLILHFDGIDVQYLVALDKTTGKTVWKTNRSTEFNNCDGDMRKAYATPLVVDWNGTRQLISPGAKSAMGYDVRTGKELWKVAYKGFSNTSRPLVLGDVALINTGFGKTELWAVRIDGQGDVTDTHVLWKYPGKTVPCKPSPALLDGLLYMINDSGTMTCLEASSGKLVWQKRMDGNYSASPLVAEKHIYVFSQEGKTTVFAAGREEKVLAQCELDDGFMASPAVIGKSLILRTKKRLLCVEK